MSAAASKNAFEKFDYNNHAREIPVTRVRLNYDGK